MSGSSRRSRVLQAFAEGFVEQYETVRNLRRGDGPGVAVPEVHRVDVDSEVRRAYLLVDTAARKWTTWGLQRWRGAKFDEARADLSQVPEVVDHDTARDAEGWLAAAAALLDGNARRVVLSARGAATSATEIDPGAPAARALDAAAAAARAAGETLAAAAVATTEADAGIAEAQAILDALR